MKKLLIFFMAGVGLVSLIGCVEKEDKVKTFAEDFGAKASKNQIDSLKLLYPVLDADSLALVYNADSITVAEASQPGNFIINFGNGVTVNITQSEDGNISATSSKGLYAFNEDDLKFAKETGMYDASLDDKALKARLAEIPAVKEHAKKEFEAANKKDLKVTSHVTGSGAGYAAIGTLHIKVTNTGKIPVKGSDYGVSCKLSWMDAGDAHSLTKVAEGKDVPVGGTVTITKEIMGSGQATGIVWKNRGASVDFDKEYKPTGKEYEAYLKSKNDSIK